MTYTSTVTSKGTITIPATIRQRMGIKEGDKVEISLHGNTIVTRLQIGWDDFFTDEFDVGAKARNQISKGEKRSLITNAQVASVIQQAKSGKYAKS